MFFIFVAFTFTAFVAKIYKQSLASNINIILLWMCDHGSPRLCVPCHTKNKYLSITKENMLYSCPLSQALWPLLSPFSNGFSFGDVSLFS